MFGFWIRVIVGAKVIGSEIKEFNELQVAKSKAMEAKRKLEKEQNG